MNERDALDVVAVRAIETSDRERLLWTDADRAWASRAAAEVVGERASPATFLARRASLVLERLGERTPKLPRMFHAWHWRPWISTALVAAAFLLGVTIDRIGGGQRINLLAPPVLGLLAWNLAVYVVLAAGFVLRYGDQGPAGAIRRRVVWLAEATRRASRSPRRAKDPEVMALAAFAGEWPMRVAPLYAARAARILHVAAAALAVGVVTGLYLRGLAFEYRATWESTFLDASSIHAILAAVYAAGSWVTGLPVPDVAHVAAIEAPASENAGPWLHRIAATLALIVIAPRLLLAAWSGLVERLRASRVVATFDAPYFQRLLREFDGGPMQLRIVPYSLTLSEHEAASLHAIAERAFGGNATVTIDAPVTYGSDLADASPSSGIRTLALFSMTATPEPETHGAFLAALRAQQGTEGALGVVIDEGTFRSRWPNEGARVDERRTLWRDFCTENRLAPAFVDLTTLDLDAAAAALDEIRVPAS